MEFAVIQKVEAAKRRMNVSNVIIVFSNHPPKILPYRALNLKKCLHKNLNSPRKLLIAVLHGNVHFVLISDIIGKQINLLLLV